MLFLRCFGRGDRHDVRDSITSLLRLIVPAHITYIPVSWQFQRRGRWRNIESINACVKRSTSLCLLPSFHLDVRCPRYEHYLATKVLLPTDSVWQCQPKPLVFALLLWYTRSVREMRTLIESGTRVTRDVSDPVHLHLGVLVLGPPFISSGLCQIQTNALSLDHRDTTLRCHG